MCYNFTESCVQVQFNNKIPIDFLNPEAGFGPFPNDRASVFGDLLAEQLRASPTSIQSGD